MERLKVGRAHFEVLRCLGCETCPPERNQVPGDRGEAMATMQPWG